MCWSKCGNVFSGSIIGTGWKAGGDLRNMNIDVYVWVCLFAYVYVCVQNHVWLVSVRHGEALETPSPSWILGMAFYSSVT